MATRLTNELLLPARGQLAADVKARAKEVLKPDWVDVSLADCQFWSTSKTATNCLRNYHSLVGEPAKTPWLWSAEKSECRRPARQWLAQWYARLTGLQRGHRLSDAETTQLFDIIQQRQFSRRVTEDTVSVEDGMIAVGAALAIGVLPKPNDAIELTRTLFQFAAASRQCQLSYLGEQFVLVELPLTLAFQVNAILGHCVDSPSGSQALKPLKAIVEFAIELIQDRIEELLDHDAWPGPALLESYGAIVGSWHRCVALAQTFQIQPTPQINEILSWTPRQLMRLIRKDKTLHFSDRKLSLEMLSWLIGRYDQPDDEILFERISKKPIQPRPNLVVVDKTRNAISPWSGSFLFHDGWERKSCRLAASIDEMGCYLEIGKNHSLIRGDVFPQLTFNGQTTAVRQHPDILVHQFDNDVAFVEIEWEFDAGLTLQRQIILSMEDQFAWIGDAVVSEQSGDIQYQCRWPLAAGVSTIEETETTEGYLAHNDEIHSLIIPPALSEWKSDRRAGRLELEKNQFTLKQQTRAKSLYAPIFIDLHPSRCRQPRTWRQLTVGEKLSIVPPEVAVAYRVQVKKKQFVFYRALGEIENRTFFGENVNTELFLGRLEKDRSMTELLQVE